MGKIKNGAVTYETPFSAFRQRLALFLVLFSFSERTNQYTSCGCGVDMYII